MPHSEWDSQIRRISDTYEAFPFLVWKPFLFLRPQTNRHQYLMQIYTSSLCYPNDNHNFIVTSGKNLKYPRDRFSFLKCHRIPELNLLESIEQYIYIHKSKQNFLFIWFSCTNKICMTRNIKCREQIICRCKYVLIYFVGEEKCRKIPGKQMFKT